MRWDGEVAGAMQALELGHCVRLALGLEALWGLGLVLGRLSPVLGRLVLVLGRLVPVLGRLGPVLGRLGPVLGSFLPTAPQPALCCSWARWEPRP